MPNDTSAAQYMELVEKGIITDQQAHIFWGFWTIGTPITDSELASSLSVDTQYVRRRRNELYQAKVLRHITKRKCQITGVTVWTWQITPSVTPTNFRALMSTWKKQKKEDKCPTCGGTGKIPQLDFLEES